MSTTVAGTVQSHTTIRVPGKAHSADAPFVLLLVALDDGKRVLGHFGGSAPPPIGARVVGSAAESQTMSFRLEEKS